jgi:hypothetical protein
MSRALRGRAKRNVPCRRPDASVYGRRVRITPLATAASIALSITSSARAQPAAPDAAPEVSSSTASAPAPAPGDEAPPPIPRRKGIVLDSTLGVLGFAGQFRHVAPPGPWLHTDLGYEIFRWLLVFAEGELAFSDTSVAQDASKRRAFALFGFGGGARVKLHVSDRVALFLQGHAGMMKADVPHNAFRLLGYADAEDLGPYVGGRLGVEWYQIDRHLALGAAGGLRDALGFARTVGADTPLAWDAGLTLRYTFPL